MAALARRVQRSTNIWPGFVDALATLLMVFMFLLMVFVLAQFFLNEALSGRDAALDRLKIQISELADLLALERGASKDLRANVAQLSADLQVSVALRDDLKTTVYELRMRAEGVEHDLAETRKELTQAHADIATGKQTIDKQIAEVAGLNRDIVALEALRKELEAKITAMASQAEDQKKALVEERELSQSTRAQIALLNQQMAVLHEQLARISEALEASELSAKEQKVEIVSLGKRLNAALASKVQELSRYRSEFFGRLRKLLGNRRGVRIVGDRFVFQSEVLFAKGSAVLGAGGQLQLDQLALTLLEIAVEIPGEIEWVLRIDGHTDSDPIKTARFPSNWELSTTRALSVVKHLVAAGLPPNRVVAAGFGEFHPLDPRADEIGKRRNRRIELKLTQR
ncbi:MAG: peptidoglycan -binding protein [Rhodospirillales bacterium]